MTLEKSDIPGLVDGKWFTEARRLSGRKAAPVGLALRKDEVVLPDGSGHRRLPAGVTKSLKYPNWRVLVPQRMGLKPCSVFSLNPLLLMQCWKAIGSPVGPVLSRMMTRRRKGWKPFCAPLLIEVGAMAGALQEYPFGLVMPMTPVPSDRFEAMLKAAPDRSVAA